LKRKAAKNALKKQEEESKSAKLVEAK